MEGQLSRRPQDTAFKQQRLSAWQPVLTPDRVSLIFLVIGIIFIPIGAVLLQKSNDIVEVSVQYDGEGVTGCGSSCTVTMDVPDKMEGTVWVYYQLDNFYQNHRRYVKSRSPDQLMGTQVGEDILKVDCDPLYKVSGSSKLLNPCGLIANSFFNDVIELTSGATMDESDISWESDREEKFKQVDGFKSAKCNTCTGTSAECSLELGVSSCSLYTDASGDKYLYYYPDSSDYQYLYETYSGVISPLKGVEDEHFIVWMRTAALPNFRKPYGRIEGGLDKGTTLTFTVTNNFDVSEFEGKKSLVISTVNAYGGKNPFLGVAYLVVGGLCLFFCLVFFLKQRLYPRPLGDVQSLKWH